MREDIDALATCNTPLYWHNCYRGTYDLIAPPSFAHPAKMSPTLCFRILQHLEELGLLKKGQDTVLDPMAGTGITNICAGAMGFKSISVELEDKFVDFQKQNKEYAERRLYKPLDWEMVKGDSRKLSELLKGSGHVALTSPPYANRHALLHDRGVDQEGYEGFVERIGDYGDANGQIANLKDQPLKAIVSPPYGDDAKHGTDGESTFQNYKDGKPRDLGQGLRSGGYGESEGQIGALPDTPLKSVMSPPYEDSEIAVQLPTGADPKKRREKRAKGEWQGYGDSEGQIGKLKDNPMKAVMSPSYGDAEKRDRSIEPSNEKERDYPRGDHNISAGYQGSPENIGKLADKPLKSITSPPYGETQDGGGLAKNPPETFRGVLKDFTQSQGEDEANIGNLKDSPMKAITSPPYSDAMNSEKTGIDFTKCAGGRDRTKEPTYDKEVNNPTNKLRYGDNEGQIGQLQDKPLKSVMSPPYAGGSGHGGNPTEVDEKKHITDWVKDQYGNSEGQIENLPDKPLKSVMSPPYDDSKIRDVKKGVGEAWRDEGYAAHDNLAGYGQSQGQIGRTGEQNGGKGESYLEAMQRVYSEIAKVSDVLVVVVKNPTRNKQLRRLDLDTIKILEMSGWRIHCQHRALLFEELQQADLFEGTKKQVKGRLSFFKRLSWQNGQPVASWEDIIVAVRN